MPTTTFANAGPVPSHTTGQALAAIKSNTTKIRDMIAMLGLQGFDYSWDIYAGGDAEFPWVQYYTGPSNTVEINNYYITGSGGNTVIDKQVIYNSGDVDIITYSYNADDIVIGASWSTS